MPIFGHGDGHHAGPSAGAPFGDIRDQSGVGHSTEAGARRAPETAVKYPRLIARFFGLWMLLAASVHAQISASAQSVSPAAQAAHEKGLALDARGAMAEALDAFSQAITLDPAFFEAWRKRGWTRNRLGDYRGAVVDFNRAVELQPTNALGWNGRAAARHKAGDMAGAMQDFEKAIALDPRYTSPWENRALLKIDQKDYRGALGDAARALQLNPKSADALQTSGTARWLQKDFAGAVADFTRAIDLDPNRAASWDGRGSAKLNMGDSRGALADLERAVTLSPQNASFVANRNAAKKNVDQANALTMVSKSGATNTQTPTQTPTQTQTPTPTPPPTSPPPSASVPAIAFKTDDPCAAGNQGTTGTPWQAVANTGEKTALPAAIGVTLPVPLNFSSLSQLQFAGAVSAAHEGMRLLYSPMAEGDAQRFDQMWAPLFDAPSREVVDYLNTLNPVLAQFLAGREAMMRAAAGYEAALLDASLAVAAKQRIGWNGAMADAQQQAMLMLSLQSGLAALARKIEALGNPPNPFTAKCGARQRHKDALTAVSTQAAPVGDVFSSNALFIHFEGVGVELAVPQRRGISTTPIPMIWDGRSFYAENRSPVYDPTGSVAGEQISAWVRGTVSADGRRIEQLTAWEDQRLGGAGMYRVNVHLRDVPFSHLIPDARNPSAVLDMSFKQIFPGGWGATELEFTAPDGKKLDWSGRPAAERGWLAVYMNHRPEAPAAQRGPLPTATSTPAATTTKSASRPDDAAQQDIRDSVAFHQANVTFLERALQREQADLSKETTPDRQRDLAFRLIQIQSDVQAEKDLIASYQSGQIVHTRSAFDEFAHQKFIEGVQEEAVRIDATRRIANGVARQISLLPADQRAAMRDKAQRILDPRAIANGDIDTARRLAGALDNEVQGYWQGQAAREEEKAIAAEESEFYLKAGVMAAGGAVVGLGGAALASTFGESAALTIWGPHLIGGVYGGATGTIAAGPAEGLKEAVAGSSMLGNLATQFLEGYANAANNPKAELRDKMWEGARQAGTAFFLGEAMKFSSGLVNRGALTFFGRDSRLFKPLGTPAPTLRQQFDAARTQQQVADGRSLISQFQDKELQLARLRQSASAGATERQKLEQELQALTGSINSSYHTKWLMKYEAHPTLRTKFNTRVEQSYDAMRPEMMMELRAMKYDVQGIEFKPMRNASSAGSSSMDLDLGLKERPGMVFVKNGRQVSLYEFMVDAQAAMNRAYHRVTGFSAVRSELNLTTSLHPESFTDLRLLKKKIDFDAIGARDIANIGGAVQVKTAKIAGDPILSAISKTQATCRETSKEIDNMLLPALRQKLQKAPNKAEAAKLQAALNHWETIQKTFKQIGTTETDPYAIIRLERTLRETTGGLGVQEIAGELSRKFDQIGTRSAR